MALNTSSGIVYSAPRVIETRDSRSGCPPTAASGSVLISQTVTLDNACVYWTHARIIFNSANAGKNRADFGLQINGTTVKEALDTATNSAGANTGWEELDASFMGTLSAGTHTIRILGQNGSNCWGCGSDWGQITTLVWEAS
jgi:hypothetical protein